MLGAVQMPNKKLVSTPVSLQSGIVVPRTERNITVNLGWSQTDMLIKHKMIFKNVTTEAKQQLYSMADT